MIVKARVAVRGPGGSLEGEALVDTGSTYTLVDRRAAEASGIRLTGRRVRLTVADGHEVVGELAIADSLAVEGEELPGAHVVVVEMGGALAERLRGLGLMDSCIVGLLTLEALGLAPDPSTGSLRRVGALLI